MWVTGNDTDDDGDWLDASVASAPTAGTASCSGGTCYYTAAENGPGEDTFTYTVTDGHGGSASATVAVTIEENHAPVAVDDDGTVRGTRANQTIDVTGNDTDADSDGLYAEVVTAPTLGTVSCSYGELLLQPDGQRR